MPLSLADTVLWSIAAVVIAVALAVELWDNRKMKRWRQQRRRKN